ncbi:sigma-70 family RNA polymerase sigma factor [Roseomonas sp. M0104]|uniref:Sigma-70 family RNA polymerase sigma factor n=1 Tax=Teichococcus coralli TaxID=2545983 RepID=A0A845BBX7_9PROT|nr:sigma-70 family RNA polymerase sigma factor [Pseudoroseomonas coralli]MXP64651.1 sigma-70 family RNA polymerase sigma factor [Pseudoroseomonas coralli]
MPNALTLSLRPLVPWEASIAKRSTPAPGAEAPLARDLSAAEDAVLLGWAAEGDRRAFDALAGRHLPLLYRVALRVTGQPAEAEEVAQEAMLRLWQNAARFDPGRARLGTWLYRITANLAIDRVRRARFQPLATVAEAPDPAPGPEATLDARQRHALLAAALEELPPRQRAALALAYDQGLSGAEAAAALSVSTRALEGLLRRARRFLAARLRGEEE